MEEKRDIYDILWIIINVVFWTFVIGLIIFYIGLEIYVLIEYGDKPIQEIPYWILQLLRRK